MRVLPSELQEYARLAQEDVNRELGVHPQTDQSAGSWCHLMTHDVYTAAAHAGMPLRRELHRNSQGAWHYILAEGVIDAIPSDDDVVVDLNPWQFSAGRLQKSPLYGTRSEVIIILRDHGADEAFVALRSLETLVLAHDGERAYDSKRGL